MQTASRLRFAGDVNIDKVLVVTSSGFGQDISAQVVNIEYFENILSPFISGVLTVRESLDLVNLFPFAGEEFVEIEVSTPSLDVSTIKGRYYIYKLSERELLGDRNVVYRLHFISTEAVVDMNKKVSKVHTGNISEIVESLLKDKTNGLQTTKQVRIDPTSRTMKFISNYWSPIECVKYLTEHATNKDNNPNYVFFENRDGFYFISLDTLYKNEVKQEFLFDKYTRDIVDSKGASTRNTQEDFKRILDMSIPVGFDYIDRIKNGTLASRLISWDMTRKQYNVRLYNYKDNFSKKVHLNEFPLASDRAIAKSASTIFTVPRMTDVWQGFGDLSNYKIIQERNSLMMLSSQSSIKISVPGRTDYTAGQKVKVTLNKIEPVSKNDSDTEDKMFSGNYIIAAINHYVNREMHTCHMELIKDSLAVNLDRK